MIINLKKIPPAPGLSGLNTSNETETETCMLPCGMTVVKKVQCNTFNLDPDPDLSPLRKKKTSYFLD